MLLACGPKFSTGGPDANGAGGDGGGGVDASASIDDDAAQATPACVAPATPAGAEVELAPEFEEFYKVYDLGAVPGVPLPLGGITVKAGTDDTLLVAGASENPGGAIYEIAVERNECGHIIGFSGTAQPIASTPNVDANLVYAAGDLMLYTEWPLFALSQLPAAATGPARRTDLRMLGMNTADQGPGGIAFVPPGLPAAGEIRVVTWPVGRWYRVGATMNAGLFDVTSVSHVATLPYNPGGFAYVPAGSAGFAAQSIIIAEWSQTSLQDDRVSVYETDDAGDPLVGTRREFMIKFPRPWGAYFEPLTGDYLFLSWGTGDDHVYIVQGFEPPPLIE